MAECDHTWHQWDARNRLTKVVDRATAGGATTQVVDYVCDLYNRRIGSLYDTDGNGTLDSGKIQRKTKATQAINTNRYELDTVAPEFPRAGRERGVPTRRRRRGLANGRCWPVYQSFHHGRLASRSLICRFGCPSAFHSSKRSSIRFRITW